MIKCNYCGKEGEETQVACARCGAPFKEGPLSPSQRASIPMGIGWVLQIASQGFSYGDDPRSRLLVVVCLVSGAVFVIWGCMRLAVAKGYTKWLGLVGIFSCLGVLFLAVLPRIRQTESPQSEAAE